MSKKSPSKKSPLFVFFKARFEYLECVHQGPKEDLPERLRREATHSILKQLSFTKAVSVQEAVELTTLLSESLVPEMEAREIRSAIQEKADLVGDGQHGSAPVAKQTHLHLEHYQSPNDWACYSAEIHHDKKLATMAERIVSLHLRSPTEPTYANAVAICLHSDGPHEPWYLLSKVRRLKEFVASLTKALPKIECPSVYPESVDEFKASYSVLFAAAFGSESPAQCPIPVSVLAMLKGSTPCRKTKTGCSVVPSQQPGKQSRHIVASAMHRQLDMPLLPGFQWCQPQPWVRPCLPSAPMPLCGQWKPATPLALTDAPRVVEETQQSGSVSCPSALGQRQLPAETVQPPCPGPTPTAVAPAGQPPASMSASITSLVAKWQAKAVEVKEAQQEVDKDSEAGEIAPGRAVKGMKRPAAAIATPTKARTKTAKKAKSKTKKTSKASTKTAKKAIATPTKTSTKTAKKAIATPTKTTPKASRKVAMETLEYKPGKQPPRFFGSVTIYSDGPGKKWRVKPRPGSRLDMKFSWRADTNANMEQWADLVKHVKSLKQV